MSRIKPFDKQGRFLLFLCRCSFTVEMNYHKGNGPRNLLPEQERLDLAAHRGDVRGTAHREQEPIRQEKREWQRRRKAGIPPQGCVCFHANLYSDRCCQGEWHAGELGSLTQSDFFFLDTFFNIAINSLYF